MPLVPWAAAQSATATQLVRDFPEVRRLADVGPVQITSHGRTELVMLSPGHFATMTDSSQGNAGQLDGKLSVIIENIDTAIMILDEDLCVRLVNQAMCAMSGIDAAALIGRSSSSLITHPNHRYLSERLAEVLRSSHGEVLTTPSVRYPERMLQLRLKPWPNGIILLIDDVTERLRLGELVVSDSMMETALAALDGIGTAHARSCGTIFAGSKGLGQMVGACPDALVGARLQNLVSPKSRTTVGDALRDTAEEPRRYAVEYLRDGVHHAAATMVVSSYWTPDHHACVAVALHDPHWKAG